MTCTARVLLAASVHPESGAPCCCARGREAEEVVTGTGQHEEDVHALTSPAADAISSKQAVHNASQRLPAAEAASILDGLALLQCRRCPAVSRMSCAKGLWACCTAASVQQQACRLALSPHKLRDWRQRN